MFRVSKVFQSVPRFFSTKHKLPEFVEQEIQGTNYTKSSIIKFLWPYIFPKSKKLRLVTYTTIGLLITSKLLNAGVPFVMKEVINEFTKEHPDFTRGAYIILGLTAARISVVLCNDLRSAFFSRVLQRAVKDVSNRVFWHLHTLDYTFHLQSTRTTMFAVGRAMKGVENFLRFSVNSFFPTVLEFVLASGVLWYWCGWPYLATLGGTVGIYTVFTTKYSQIRQSYIQEMKRKAKAVDFVMNESLVNYETVKCFNNERLENEKYGALQEQYKAAAMKTSRSLAILSIGQAAIFNTGLCANLLMGIQEIQQGTMTVGDLVMIQTLFMQLSFPLNFLGTIYRELDESQIEVRELFNLLNIKSKVAEIPGAQDLQLVNGTIRFEDINYAHTPERQIFKDFSLELPGGKSYALVGESGSGKSTTFRMLYRLFDPDSGRIFIDNQDLKTLTLNSLRQSIALVPQAGYLFNDSILYNLQYGNPEATFEEIVEICKLVNIHNTIMQIPNQYMAQVGELGNKLSGGERQRLTIARSLLKNAEIFLFDEATSAMDSYNEQIISLAIKEKLQEKTLVYAAHRLTSILGVDQIVVLDGGNWVEKGSHQELLDKGAKYSDLWKRYLDK